jgi:DNA polymerase III alpha subunit (gram-positive type)
MRRKGEAIEHASGFAKMLNQLKSIGEPVVMVAWNGAGYDVPMLIQELKREYSDVKSALFSHNVVGFFDALVYARDNYKSPSYKLGVVYDRMFGEPFANAHTAFADTSALMRVCEHSDMSGMFAPGWHNSKAFKTVDGAVDSYRLCQER